MYYNYHVILMRAPISLPFATPKPRSNPPACLSQCSASLSTTIHFLVSLAPLRSSPHGVFPITWNPQFSHSNLPNRLFSTHSSHRPQFPLCISSYPYPTISPQPTASSLDILPKISAHPSLVSLQVRYGPRNTFNPSHRVRKRRHGFLSRLRTRTGRMTLKRRRMKGRSTLSH